jgi:hypothetical protein
MRDVRDVESPRCNVSGHENFVFPAFETLQGLLPIFLGTVRMNHGRLVIVAPKQGVNCVGISSCPTEDDGAFPMNSLQQ